MRVRLLLSADVGCFIVWIDSFSDPGALSRASIPAAFPTELPADFEELRKVIMKNRTAVTDAHTDTQTHTRAHAQTHTHTHTHTHTT